MQTHINTKPYLFEPAAHTHKPQRKLRKRKGKPCAQGPFHFALQVRVPMHAYVRIAFKNIGYNHALTFSLYSNRVEMADEGIR